MIDDRKSSRNLQKKWPPPVLVFSFVFWRLNTRVLPHTAGFRRNFLKVIFCERTLVLGFVDFARRRAEPLISRIVTSEPSVTSTTARRPLRPLSPRSLFVYFWRVTLNKDSKDSKSITTERAMRDVVRTTRLRPLGCYNESDGKNHHLIMLWSLQRTREARAG